MRPIGSTLPTQVHHDLRRLIESEELGNSYFGTAARLTAGTPAERAWTALRDLENQTILGARRFLGRGGIDLPASQSLARAAGVASGYTAMVLPAKVRSTLLEIGTGRYLPAFHRLAEFYRRSDDSAFFDYVVAHEKAIIAYARGTLRDERDPLSAVLRLLESPVPGLD